MAPSGRIVGHTEVIAKYSTLRVIKNFHQIAVTHSSHNRRAHFPQPCCTHRRRCHSNRALLWNRGDRDATDFFCSSLPAHIARPLSHRPSQFSRPAFFYRSFFWALLQANSCVLQFGGFCFPGSAFTPFGFPPSSGLDGSDSDALNGGGSISLPRALSKTD